MKMDVTDRLKEVLDSVKPLVREQNFGLVCERLETECVAARNEQRFSDAASLSAMLGSFRSMTGDEEAALRALQSAEELDPSNAHRSIDTAAHLFARMQRTGDAATIATRALDGPSLDPLSEHEALSLLGRIAAAEDRLNEAATFLVKAETAATTGNLDALFWDQSLPNVLAERSEAVEVTRKYLETLTRRAELESDEDTVSEVANILAKLDR